MINRFIVEVDEMVERKVRYTVDACDTETAVELALEGEGFDMELIGDELVASADLLHVYEKQDDR